jgi:cellobiose phosphorylase
VFSYARLVLGALPEELAFATVVEAAGDGRTLRASNGLAGPFAGGVAFASAATPSREAEISFTADRRGFLGVGGAPERPRALAEDAVLDGRTGARLDPCFAHQVRVSLPEGTSAECVFVLGEGDDPVAGEALVARFARASAFEEAHYVATTGDAGVLEARVASVTARLLEPGEDEAYLPTQRANEEVSVYEHCCRAIDRSLGVGDHGLPRMGTGDWNDGMNRVGREGRGESVWMAFFLHDVLRAFEPLCHMRGDTARAGRARPA